MSEHRVCVGHCKSPVPKELEAKGLCVSHFTLDIEKTCADMHRQIALRGVSPERQAEMAVYLEDCSVRLARVSSSMCLSDQLKRRVLSTFLSLMNLRETLERANGMRGSSQRTSPTAATFPA